MNGKQSIPHLFNNGGSTQMKPQEFLKLMDFISTRGYRLSGEDFIVSEKIDGSSNFIGYDELGPYVQTFAMKDAKVYKEDYEAQNCSPKASELFEIYALNEDAVKLMKQTSKGGHGDVKVQIELVLTGYSKSEDPEVVQTVLVPYKRSLLAPRGNGFLIQALEDVSGEGVYTTLLVNEQENFLEALALYLSKDGFKCDSSVPIIEFDRDGIDLKNEYEESYEIVAEVMDKYGLANSEDLFIPRSKQKKEITERLGEIQKVIQSKLTTLIDKGKFGDFYEGLVFSSSECIFKVTSEDFKNWMKARQQYRQERK